MTTDIKFARNYGLAPASPFWLVWCEDRDLPSFKHPTRADAEQEAARLAGVSPGRSFHVLVVMSTIKTSTDIIGEQFDPNRVNPRELAVEEPAPEFEPTTPPAFLEDDQPF